MRRGVIAVYFKEKERTSRPNNYTPSPVLPMVLPLGSVVRCIRALRVQQHTQIEGLLPFEGVERK